jgi:hypothetical protein
LTLGNHGLKVWQRVWGERNLVSRFLASFLMPLLSTGLSHHELEMLGSSPNLLSQQVCRLLIFILLA